MKRFVSYLLLAAMVLTLLPATVVSAFADGKTELPVEWHMGYIGAATNSNAKNDLKDGGGGGTYYYTDVITIPKAGTKISFTLDKNYPYNNIWLFSEWKQSGSNWIFDPAGANVATTFENGKDISKIDFVGQKYVNGKMEYSFISDHDNQSIRICTRTQANSTGPKVYQETTTEPSTKAQLAALEFTATFEADGTVKNIRWFNGYTSSETNDNGSAREWKYCSNAYAFSGFIKVPKAGTKISYTSGQAGSAAFNAFTRYKLVNGYYTYDIGVASNSSYTKSGTTFSYVTKTDNEIIRIGCNPKLNYETVEVAEPVEVKWEATTDKATEDLVGSTKTEWPAPELLSLVTGAPLIGKELADLEWVSGYIGSQYKDNVSQQLVYTSPGNQYYFTSDAFKVPKAGTTVYFFDQTYSDFGGGTLSSPSALAVSHWTEEGRNGTLDKSKEYLTGCEVYNLGMTENYRLYAYTTKEANEIIRLCLRLASPIQGEKLIPPVYLVEPSDFDAEQPAETVKPGTVSAAKLYEGSYTDANGTVVGYKYYLPYAGQTADGQYALVFDNSADGKVAEFLATKAVKKAIVVQFNGALDVSLRLLDEFVKDYPVKVSDIMLVGGDELAAHAKKFETIRLANAFLYTGTGAAPKFEYAACQKLGDNMEESVNWLLGKYSNYYNVLEGLKMYAMGDSYFGGSGLGQHQTWVNLMGYKYDMTFHNFGIGGNTVASASGINSDSPPMHTRFEEMPTDGDIYLLEGGRNDRHYSVPFGTNDSMDGKTFKGAFNIMIKGIREKNPDAMIVLVTPWSSKKENAYLGTNDDYADALQELADSYNDPHIVCLYAADVEFTEIDMSDPACRKEYCLSASDYSHLNAKGMYMVLPKFDKWIASKYAALNKLQNTNDASDKDLFFTISEDVVDTTTGETTTEPDSTTTVVDATTEAPEKGCGGFSVFAAMLALICTAAVVVIKKK